MFLFSCCTTVQTENQYLVNNNAKKNAKFFNSLIEVDQLYASDITQIIKLKKSDYRDVIETCASNKQKWTDSQFPPNPSSIGNIEGLNTNNWRRLSQIVSKPVVFDNKIQPQDIIQGNLGDCYFLSALAALAQVPERIRQCFVSSQFSPQGVYCVRMRIDGIIKQIVIDDYVPVNQLGSPIFCQPNKDQIWIPLLQKVWAKVNKGYNNIIAGNPVEVMKAITFAPSQNLIISQKKQKIQKIWEIIYENAKLNNPCCCGTNDSQQIQWRNLNLVPGHAYSLIDAIELTQLVNSSENRQIHANVYRILKLRNPWGTVQWQGKASQNDKDFWNKKFQNSPQIDRFLNQKRSSNDGIFFILYQDFIKYFVQIQVCYMQKNANFIWQQMYLNGKNGSFYQTTIQNTGTYTFEVHQESLRSKQNSKLQSGLGRSTIVIGRLRNPGVYQYVASAMKFAQQDVSVKCELSKGEYVIYAKIDRNQVSHSFPNKTSISVYSKHYCPLNMTDKLLHQNFLQKVFLYHAKQNKRQTHNNDQMWISWKLLFKQSGFAYIAFGNHSKDKKYIIKFSQGQFQQMNFKLKSPFRHKQKLKNKQFQIQVKPSQEKIILARVKNSKFNTLKFPPPIQMKLVNLQQPFQSSQKN